MDRLPSHPALNKVGYSLSSGYERSFGHHVLGLCRLGEVSLFGVLIVGSHYHLLFSPEVRTCKKHVSKICNGALCPEHASCIESGPNVGRVAREIEADTSESIREHVLLAVPSYTPESFSTAARNHLFAALHCYHYRAITIACVKPMALKVKRARLNRAHASVGGCPKNCGSRCRYFRRCAQTGILETADTTWVEGRKPKGSEWPLNLVGKAVACELSLFHPSPWRWKSPAVRQVSPQLDVFEGVFSFRAFRIQNTGKMPRPGFDLPQMPSPGVSEYVRIFNN